MAILDGILKDIIALFDEYLDRETAQLYKDQPLAQDWARVAKCGEEAGEAIAALIGMTGQNPRKGVYNVLPDVIGELADVWLTALLAIQHFTKDTFETEDMLRERLRYRLNKAGIPYTVPVPVMCRCACSNCSGCLG